MILQALTEYYQAKANKNEIVKLGWTKERIGFLLAINERGELLNIIPHVKEESFGKKTKLVNILETVPEKATGRTGNSIVPNFLSDKAAYLLGLDTKGDVDKAQRSFAAARVYHKEILRDFDDPASRAIKNFFGNWSMDRLWDNQKFEETAQTIKDENITFLIYYDDGKIEMANKNVHLHEAWQKYQESQIADEVITCLVTGKKAPITPLHASIRGIPGTKAEPKLIGYKPPAFDSYGSDGKNRPKGYNSPIGKFASFAYSTALNHLLASDKNRIRIGDTTILYWAADGNDEIVDMFNLMYGMPHDDEKELDGIMKHLAKGELPDKVDVETKFYVLGLSPNAARISVRFFFEDKFGNYLTHLQNHYQQLAIVHSDNEREYLRPYMLIESIRTQGIQNENYKNLLTADIMKSILLGTPYPRSLVSGVLQRIQREQDNKDKGLYRVTRARVAILKAYLLRQSKIKDKEMITVALNKDWKNKAYVLGRLFSVLEDLQKDASGIVNSSVKATYFTSASTTPRMVFPRLMQLSTVYMNKFSGEKEYLRAVYDKKIGDLYNLLDAGEETFPKHFSEEEQCLFILGYYHERKAIKVKKKSSEGEDNLKNNEQEEIKNDGN